MRHAPARLPDNNGMNAVPVRESRQDAESRKTGHAPPAGEHG